MGRIIAVANQKGGVGKTTTAINLAACLAEAGKKVLTIDLDPQGNMTSGLGVDKNEVENTVYELMLDECSIKESMTDTVVDGMKVIPSNVNLAGAEIELLGIPEKEYILRNAVDYIKEDYDFIVIDCPPSLNMLTINAMTTANSVLVPIQCEYYALEGLSQLIHTIDLVQQRLNPNLLIEGVVFTMYDVRTNLSNQVVENVRNNLDAKIYDTLIPRNIRLAEAPSYGLPINLYDSKSAGAESYRLLAKEVIGLDSLITNKVNNAKTTTATIKPAVKKDEKVVEGILVNINKVEPNREQPRKNFDEDALLELAESIKQFGVLQPLLVQQKDDYYEIIAGERRWRAAKLANLKEVPVIIKKLTEQEVVEISLIENIQRENLNPIEEAIAYKRLLTEFNLKQDEVAERVSKSRTAVTNSMRLLKLNEKVQQMVIDDMISTGHARALLGLNDLEKQYTVAQQIFDEKLSVRETEKLVKKIQQEKNQKDTEKNKKIDPKLEAICHDLEEKMKGILGTKVAINQKDNKKGKIEIEYYSMDELDRIMDLFRTIEK